MRRPLLLTAAAAALSFGLLAAGLVSAQPKPDLRDVESFAAIPDQRLRSIAIFEEAGQVITHPRCVNCHPVDDRPLQGAERRPHQPPVLGGTGGTGPAGMPCTTCHGKENVTLAGTTLRSIPGNPHWHLAPASMAWEGKGLPEICRQIKDTARNGGRDLAALHEHMAKDSLVGWAWNPGPGREPAPGTQDQFGRLIKAWIDTGAVCPG